MHFLQREAIDVGHRHIENQAIGVPDGVDLIKSTAEP